MHLKIGKYRIIRELGRGGMGVVYLATDESLDRDVAIKIIRPGLHVDEHGIERFKYEARAAAHLSHPHVVHVNALDEIDGQIVIEMPYLAGGSLRDRIRAGMSVGGLARTTDQMLQALECCHAANIIHRDVKPSNILFDEAGLAKLSDFGAATLAAEELGSSVTGDATTFIGTPRYSCPESWDRGAPSPAWDLFSLGVLTWEAIAGDLPNSKLSPLAFLRQLHQKPLPPLREAAPEVSAEFADLINRLCAQDPADRPASATEARKMLSEAPEMEGASSGTDLTTRIRYRRRLRRLAFRDQLTRTLKKTRRYTLPVTVSLAAGVLLSAAWYTWFSPDSRAAVLPSGETVRRQADIVAADVPDADALLAAQRSADGEAIRAYDVVGAEPSAAGNRLLAAFDDSGGRAMGVIDGDMLLFRLVPKGDDAYRVDGVWGSYREAQRRALLFGRLEGTAAVPVQPSGPVQFSLTYFSDVTIESWKRSFVAAPLPPDVTDASIVHAWESDAAVFPVLTRELLPRFEEHVDIAKSFAPIVAGTWLDARIASSAAGSQSAGALEESDWAETGSAVAMPQDRDARLRAAGTDTDLFVRLNVNGPWSSDEPITLALLPGYDVPRERSGVLNARITDDGIEATMTTRGISNDVGDRLGVQTSSFESGTQIEIRIPMEALGRKAGPVHGEIFRLNVRLDRPGSAGDVLVWGWPGTGDAAHGLILRFVSSEESSTL